MQQFIEECLQPVYKLHCLESIYFDPILVNDIMLFIAMQDNRLLRA
jgi:hypothetical protein